ncbi:Uncharacterised protein [Chlamydia abortus]|nr:Uncharacterised protein [Chlamydia abortus]
MYAVFLPTSTWVESVQCNVATLAILCSLGACCVEEYG